MKATFPTGESKKSSKPRPQTRPVSERERFPTGARQLQQYQTGDGRGGERRVRERESKDGYESERGGERGEVSEVLFLSSPSRVSA